MLYRRSLFRRLAAAGAALLAPASKAADANQQPTWNAAAPSVGRAPRLKSKWVESVFPWQQLAAEVNGKMMAYIDEGPRDARPVVLCHGNPRWGLLYRHFIPPLREAGYRVVIPDWIGSGYSDKPRNDASLTLAGHIADLVSLMDQLDLDQFALVGHDWGGPQGVGAAMQRIDRLSALVLMNTWVFREPAAAFHRSARPWMTWHAPIVGKYMMERKKILLLPNVVNKNLTPTEFAAYTDPYQEPESDHVLLTWPRTIPLRTGDRGWHDMQGIEERLGELATVPTILIWAPADPVFTMDTARALKQFLPHAEGPVTVAGAMHFLLDDKGPEVARITVDFLNRKVGAKL